MILTLPHALGGRLNGAVFNYEVKLKAELKKRLGTHRCLQTCFTKARLAIEYDSFTHHSSRRNRGEMPYDRRFSGGRVLK